MKSLLQGLCNEQSRPALKPEERLLLAVVESAYWDLQSPDPTKRRTASTYFLDDKDHHAFSFVSICQHFSWSPGSIRYQLGTLLGPVVDDEHVRVEAAAAGMRHSSSFAVR
jgi:hypothetical protein